VLKFLKKYAATCCLALVLTFGTGSPYAQDSTEYSVKAAYIYNFIKFVKWPDGFDTETRPAIDICVIGDSELLQAKSVFQQASTAKLTISLVQENNFDNIASHCHVVFIGEGESGKLKDILAATRGKPVLTVSDLDGFADHGGMIGFALLDDKIKFAINPKSAAANGLKIDARLLEIAVKVIGR
jgi:hypothetical protein